MAEATLTKKPSQTVQDLGRKTSPKPKKATAPSKALFAVFTTGGKQYRVKVGDKVKIEKILGEHKEGEKITFDKVLLTDDGKDNITLGTPYIEGGEVKATLNKIGRAKKIEVIKYKSKSRYFKRYGHRQPFFEIVIDSIK